jgi:hypothetical protein
MEFIGICTFDSMWMWMWMSMSMPDAAAAAMTQEVVGPGAVRGDCNRIYTSGPALGPEGLHAASHVH